MTGLDRVLRRAGAALWVAAGALVAAAPALAGDAAVQARIERRLQRAGLADGADLKVEVKNGEATLRGVAMTLEAKRGAEKAARKETKAVNNLIRVFPDARKDQDILKDARNAVLGYPYYSVFDSVELGVQDGVVLLRGSVRDELRRSDIEAAVARVPGLREVENQIMVQPTSFFDDDLRRQIYRAIYGDRLRQFAGHPLAPVRIVVDSGRVTLTGWVNSEVDRQVFGHIARSTMAFGVDNRIKVDGEAPETDRPLDDDDGGGIVI
jgi:osmotically-inducible protein OsmY